MNIGSMKSKITKARKHGESFEKYKVRQKAEKLIERNQQKAQKRGIILIHGANAAKMIHNQVGTNDKTPRNSDFPNLNREGRRGLLYRNKLSSLLENIARLRYDMIGAGIKVPKMPRFKNPKFLSGYYSELITLSLAKEV